VREVISCEHDAAWLERIRARAPANVSLRHVVLDYDGAYCRTAAEYPGHFDIIVIDGRDRVNCAFHAVGALAAGGIIVWDDTDREEYRKGLRAFGAGRLSPRGFIGLSPGINERRESQRVLPRSQLLGL